MILSNMEKLPHKLIEDPFQCVLLSEAGAQYSCRSGLTQEPAGLEIPNRYHWYRRRPQGCNPDHSQSSASIETA